MTDKEAIKLALEALENGKRVRAGEGGTKYQPDLEDVAIAALRQAPPKPEQTKCPRCGEVTPAEIHTCSPQVAQPEQEPVRWFQQFGDAPPKQWVGLTDEEIDYIFGLAYADDMELLRTIEAKLKDKNG